jgi:hypothetical protein
VRWQALRERTQYAARSRADPSDVRPLDAALTSVSDLLCEACAKALLGSLRTNARDDRVAEP